MVLSCPSRLGSPHGLETRESLQHPGEGEGEGEGEGGEMWSGVDRLMATPSLDRDGSAVELVGLCHSAVSWLAKLHSQGTYPYSGVKMPSEEQGRVPESEC